VHVCAAHRDGEATFQVTILGAQAGSDVVLFAVGAGGNPERHLPLLTRLADAGRTVVAPHFERLVSPFPSEGDLLLRARRLRLALDAVAQSGSKVAAVGHSIGAAVLLALAGGQMWLRSGDRADITSDERLSRLVLLAPPTGYFQAPRALDAVRIPVLAWAGSADTITPPAQLEVLERGLWDGGQAHFRVTEGAGHFSFMDVPPPHVAEPLPDRQAFLDTLASEVRAFLTRPTGVDPARASGAT
jgi:pimeloyl-ACP methyl ester carboxylesterase